MKRGYQLPPQPVLPDVTHLVDMTGNMSGQSGYKYFEFNNYSKYFICVRYDRSQSNVLRDPEEIIKPLSTELVELDEAEGVICWAATTTTGYPLADVPAGTDERFWFSASNVSKKSTPAYSSVGLQGAIETTGTVEIGMVEVNKVVNDDFAAPSNVINARFTGEAFPRFVANNNGAISIGPGQTAPTNIFSVNSNGQAVIGPRVVTTDPVSSLEITNKQYTDSGDNKTLLSALDSARAADGVNLGKANGYTDARISNTTGKTQVATASTLASTMGAVTPFFVHKQPNGLCFCEGIIRNVSSTNNAVGTFLFISSAGRRSVSANFLIPKLPTTGSWVSSLVYFDGAEFPDRLRVGRVLAPGETLDMNGLTFMGS